MQAVLLCALILSAAACSSELKLTEATDPNDLIEREVVMSEYKIEPAHIKVPVNATVRFVIGNEGNFTHEFRILTDPNKVIEIAPKSEDRMDVVFDKPGEYEFADTTSNNEKLGMKGTISVESVE